MNYLAHGLRFLARPYCLAGTAVPDWLHVIGQGVRIRRPLAEQFLGDARPEVAELATGIVEHHRDDQQFHATAAFQQLCWELTAGVRDCSGGDPGMRPAFVGHILVEILLDAHLAAARRDLVRAYYGALGTIDRPLLQAALDHIAPRQVPGWAALLDRFLDEQFLYDYLEDGKLLMRLNQVMRRVGLPPLPARLRAMLPDARRLVDAQLPGLVHFQPPLVACLACAAEPRGERHGSDHPETRP
jgi:hypothetical protein